MNPNVAKTTRGAITIGLMNAFKKEKVQYRMVKDEKHRFLLSKENEKPIILIYNSNNVMVDKVEENDFPQ